MLPIRVTIRRAADLLYGYAPSSGLINTYKGVRASKCRRSREAGTYMAEQQIAAVSPSRHQDFSFSRFEDYRFAATDMAAPIVGAELAQVVRTYPICFLKDDGGHFFLAALLSVAPGKNLFVRPDTGRWMGYVPAHFRSHPFRLARHPEQQNPVFCIDEGSEWVHDKRDVGEPIFTAEGKPTEEVEKIINFLKEVENNKSATARAVTALASAGVIQPWPVKTKGDHGQEQTLNNVYAVDETKFNGLDDETFIKIRHSGALPIVYSQLLSMPHIEMVMKLAEAHSKIAESGGMQPQKSQLDSLFIDDDDGLLNLEGLNFPEKDNG